MKTIAATLIILSSGLGLNTIALAEPFNEGGVHHLYTVQPDPNAPRTIVDTTASQPFNDRGTDYIVEAVPGISSWNSDIPSKT
ncbi:MAG: hypothetical protein HC808_00100 [Candidatus Competibacteraceae bacterium]|nr:hypothetical protein [Candidatus Competibacteraceae bacterium]